MFTKTQTTSMQDPVTTTIGPGMIVKGDLIGKGDILIAGSVKGSIKSKGKIIISKEANISAEIEAASAKVGGIITGNIKVDGKLEIMAGATINGNISCASVSIENGAFLNGKCDMRGPEAKEIKDKLEKK